MNSSTPRNSFTHALLLVDSQQKSGDARGAIATLEQLQKDMPGQPMALNSFAWFLVTTSEKSLRDPRRALDLARLAVTATKEKDPAILDTLADAYHANGMFKEAVETEEKAAALAPEELKSALARFRQALETGKPVDRPPDPVPQSLAENPRPADEPKAPEPAAKNDENPFARYNREQAEKDKEKNGQ